MTENATIFIPDISGYTDFMSKTELEHSSHIINELLDLLVQSNTTACTLAEVEGDALLFYRKGEPIPLADLTAQCLDMFQNFHTLLKVIERDSICQCGACQTASNLTLKFVIHYGTIKEIKVANFVKASGVDMIVAHRLLKNKIGSNEYILATRAYLDHNNGHAADKLAWQTAFEEYPAVGKIDFQYALLETIKSALPDLPPRETPKLTLSEGALELDIAAPMLTVYRLMTDLGNRKQWANGVIDAEGDKPIDRLGVQHRCFFEDVTAEITPAHSDVRDDQIHYVEFSHIPKMGLKCFADYMLMKRGENLTHAVIKVGMAPGHELPPEAVAAVLQNYQASGESFKAFCESHV